MWEHTNLMLVKDEGCLNNTMVGVMQVISLGSKELTVFLFSLIQFSSQKFIKQ